MVYYLSMTFNRMHIANEGAAQTETIRSLSKTFWWNTEYSSKNRSQTDQLWYCRGGSYLGCRPELACEWISSRRQEQRRLSSGGLPSSALPSKQIWLGYWTIIHVQQSVLFERPSGKLWTDCHSPTHPDTIWITVSTPFVR